MLLLFDEVWSLCHHVSQMLADSLQNVQAFDFFTYHSSHSGADSFEPRDMDIDNQDFTKSFREDNTPKFASVYVQLTKYSPASGTLHYLPAGHDPDYYHSLETNALPTGIEKIVAVPSSTGDMSVWSHRLLHWTNATAAKAPIKSALSFVVSDSAYSSPVLQRGKDALPFPTWDERIVLCAYQVVKYHHRIDATKIKHVLAEILTQYGPLLSPMAHEDPTYQHNFAALFLQ